MRDNDDLIAVDRALWAADQPLDEVARMRMQARLFAAADVQERSTPRRFRWWMVPGLVVPVAAAVAAAMVLLLPTIEDRAGRADRDVPSFTRLEVPAGAKIDTRLGGRARVQLTGPAVVEVVSTSPSLIAIRLPVGTLVGDYDHSAGGTLRIDSPGATTEVVGTRFAVEASAMGTRVSVAHGRVKVRGARGHTQDVNDAQSWTSQQETVGALAPAAQTLFDESPAGTAEAKLAPLLVPSAAEPTPPAFKTQTLAQPQPLHPTRKLVRRESAKPLFLRSTASPVRSPTGPVSTLAAGLPAEQNNGAGAREHIEAETPPGPAVPLVSALELPPPSPPSVKPIVVASPQELIERLYASAESAMKGGDVVRARTALEQVVRTGSGAVVTAARFDLARLVARSGDRDGAARILDELLAADPNSPLRGPARFLRCRLDAERGQSTPGGACLRF